MGARPWLRKGSLKEARAAIERLAALLPSEELTRQGFALYEAFRLEVPVGAKG